MTKKQRNRKLIAQNKRNKIINKRYTSTIKTLSKCFLLKLTGKEKEISDTNELKNQTSPILNKLYSIIDKAVKKGVIHKNTASRKKSKIFHKYSTYFLKAF